MMAGCAPAAILPGTYVVLAVGQAPLLRIDRTGAAIIGAVLMVTVGGLPLDQACRAVDYRTRILLFGMMVLIANLQLAQFFTSLARLVVSSIHHPAAQFVAVVFASGILSALLSNLTSNVPAVMLFTRVVPHLPDPRASWLALAMSSTLAGNLTILGSIANIYVVEGARRRGITISCRDCLRVGLPVTLLTLGFGTWWLS